MVVIATSEHGSMVDSEDLASQTAVMLRIDLIHTSMEAEQKWVSPHVEVKVKSRLASHTFPCGERVVVE